MRRSELPNGSMCSKPSAKSAMIRNERSVESTKTRNELSSESTMARDELFTSSDADYQAFLAQSRGTAHPERYTLGKPRPDRARQFKPFAALRGYEELVARAMTEANEPHDFTAPEESC